MTITNRWRRRGGALAAALAVALLAAPAAHAVQIGDGADYVGQLAEGYFTNGRDLARADLWPYGDFRTDVETYNIDAWVEPPCYSAASYTDEVLIDHEGADTSPPTVSPDGTWATLAINGSAYSDTCHVTRRYIINIEMEAPGQASLEKFPDPTGLCGDLGPVSTCMELVRLVTTGTFMFRWCDTGVDPCSASEGLAMGEKTEIPLDKLWPSKIATEFNVLTGTVPGQTQIQSLLHRLTNLCGPPGPDC